ncbi:EF-hand domain pair domain-containing protein [Ditylenchus destructor]|uniref:EF-hand domain pair domain-containing protein n=1 Tax=Ditylenchus destructor TaxID=166010 RepID=A0AAD4MEQ6_9BILA|nr:EF-hand domain pair domain-containing protein [Ditylenchus destructor]
MVPIWLRQTVYGPPVQGLRPTKPSISGLQPSSRGRSVHEWHAYDLDMEFKKADTNGDGKLSLEEVVAYFPKEMEDLPRTEFARVDTNNDSYITLEEARPFEPQNGIFASFLN